jgi:hypothetical protein
VMQGSSLHVKDSGLDGKRIPVSLRDQVMLDAHDLPAIARAVAGVLGSSPAVRQSPSGDAQSVVDAGLAVIPDMLSSSRDVQEKQLRRQLNFGCRYGAYIRRGVLLAMGSACLAALAVVVLFGMC